jgi:hypothetical protein
MTLYKNSGDPRHLLLAQTPGRDGTQEGMPNRSSSRPAHRIAATEHELDGTRVVTTATNDACGKAALHALARALGRQAAAQAWMTPPAPASSQEPHDD